MKRIKNKIYYFLLTAFSFALILPAKAANLKDAFGENTLNKVAGNEGAGYNIAKSDPTAVVGVIIQAALGFVGVIFMLLMIYAGYLWMTARGNEEDVAKAKKIITASIIGLIIVVSAYAISYLVIFTLGDATLKPGAN